MKKFFLTILIFGMTVFIFSAGKKLILQGSTTVFPITEKAAEEFMKIHPDLEISVRGGGSGVGIASLIDGVCDIADASRPMKKSEIKRALSKGVHPTPHIIALDGISVIVNRSNPINGITIEKLKEIYTGKIRNWKELGGKDLKIIVVSRDSSSGTFETFNHIVLKHSRVTPYALMQASNMAVQSVVKRTKGAIGYVGLGYVTPEVKPLKVNGIMPSEESVRDGKYPLSRPLFLYTNGNPSGIVKSFIDFLMSKKGQEIVKKEGFIPVKKF